MPPGCRQLPIVALGIGERSLEKSSPIANSERSGSAERDTPGCTALRDAPEPGVPPVRSLRSMTRGISSFIF